MSSSPRRIVRSDDATATPAAASLLVQLPPASARDGRGNFNGMLEEVRRSGYEEGYRAATSELAAAEAAGRAAQLRRVADALVTASAEIRQARAEAVTAVSAEAAELAYRLCEAFLQRELQVEHSCLDAVVRALALVPDEDDLVVRINPADAVDVEEIRHLVPDASVRVVADRRVEPGGCVVTAGPCRIDTQMGAALERVRDVLDELYPAPPVTSLEDVA
jgi:flagellar assembly protein FliH